MLGPNLESEVWVFTRTRTVFGMFWIEDEYLVNNMGSTSESLEKFLIKGHTYIRIISKTLSFRSPVISIS